MDIRNKIVAILSVASLLIVVLELVRRKRMKEEYSVLWVVAAGTMLVFVLWEGLQDALAGILGTVNTSSLFFFLSILFTLFFLLHFSLKISDSQRGIKVLTQELALLKWEHEELAKKMGAERGKEESRPE